MSGVYSILGFVAQLKAIEHDIDAIAPAIIARACEMVANAAKEALGTYEFGWISLKPETIARKMRGDSPLLETGAMRDSIEWNASGLEGHVGSNSDIAVFQELGTVKTPPRSFLGAAAAQQEELIYKMAAKAVRAVMRGEGLRSSELGELLHLLKHVGHALKEAADTILDGPDEEKRR
jgi:bacteriophage HK97-gp10 putative tail-component